MNRISAQIIAAACLALAFDAHGWAQEPLRWKFAASEQFETNVEQEMRLKMEGPDNPLATIAREELDMTWKVKNVTLTGDAVLVGKCDRVQASLADADKEGQGLRFDSASDEPAAGLAAMMAPMYEAILAGEFEVTVSSRGEVRNVHIPDEVEQQLRSAPGAEATGPDAAVDAFRAMIVQWIVQLPAEPLTAGQTWSTRTQVYIPGCKSAMMITEYRYDGTRDVDGRLLAVLHPTMTLEIASEGGGAPTVKDERTSGDALFDVAAGRLRSMNIEHRATLSVVADGQMQEGAIEQRIDVSLRGRDE